MRTDGRSAPIFAKPSKLEPRRVKVVDEIIDSLRQDIITRRLPHGERLPSERELSERFGVSQPSVREAIRALETLGLVDVFHGSGRFVRSEGDYALASALQTLVQLNDVGVVELLLIRHALGELSIRLASRHATDEDIKSIASSYARLDDLDQIQELDLLITEIIEFQRAVSAAAHSPLLQSLEAFLMVLLTEAQMKSLAGRDVGFWRSRAKEFQPRRLEILQALKSRSEEKAEAAMKSYFEAQRRLLEEDQTSCKLNVSNPSFINIVANMVRRL